MARQLDGARDIARGQRALAVELVRDADGIDRERLAQHSLDRVDDALADGGAARLDVQAVEHDRGLAGDIGEAAEQKAARLVRVPALALDAEAERQRILPR